MAVFAIISLDQKPQLLVNIDTQYSGKSYRVSDRVAFISTSDAPKRIAGKLGVQTRDADNAVVPGMRDVVITKVAPAYYGWTDTGFWEWLKSAHQEDSV